MESLFVQLSDDKSLNKSQMIKSKSQFQKFDPYDWDAVSCESTVFPLSCLASF